MNLWMVKKNELVVLEIKLKIQFMPKYLWYSRRRINNI